MKHCLLDFLVCPDCEEPLAASYLDYDGNEIKKGMLSCARCQRQYPILEFIPRFLPSKLPNDKRLTAKAFGWEWKEYRNLLDLETYKSQFLDWVFPLNSECFKDKVVLDAGCGMGRFSQVVSQFGARHVLAVDLSEAVEAAYANTKHLMNVHVIQADLCKLPFRKFNAQTGADIDVIYSIGVLHHLRHPQKGFESLVRHLKRNGQAIMMAWVYGYENNEWIIKWVNPVRKRLTAKCPPFLLNAIAFIIALPLHLLLKGLYGPVHKAHWKLRLPYEPYFTWLSQFGFFHTCHVIFDHLIAPIAFYIRQDEFKQWFLDSGLKSVRISWRNENSWRGIAYL